MNYFKAAEQVLSSVPDLERSLENLEHRKERLLSEGSPRGIAELDFDKPFVDTRYINKTLTEALSLSECARCIDKTRSDLEEIRAIIEQLSKRRYHRDSSRISRARFTTISAPTTRLSKTKRRRNRRRRTTTASSSRFLNSLHRLLHPPTSPGASSATVT